MIPVLSYRSGFDQNLQLGRVETARQRRALNLLIWSSPGEAAAHDAVDRAKVALGERGPIWWEGGALDLNRHLGRTEHYGSVRHPSGQSALIWWERNHRRCGLSGKETYMSKLAVITGAIVSGNTAAAVLADHDFEVVVVEKAEAFVTVGRMLMRRWARGTSPAKPGGGRARTRHWLKGTVWVNEDGSEAARCAVDENGNGGPTAEMEILRGDLTRILYDAAKDHTAYRFGDRIEAVEGTVNGASVTFSSGTTDTFHAVIVAEGGGSSTRELIFKGANDPRWMDMAIACFTILCSNGDDRMWRWFNALGKRSVSLRPDRHGATGAMVSVSKEAQGDQDWDVER